MTCDNLVGGGIRGKNDHGVAIFTMPHAFTTLLYIAPADRWNTDSALPRNPPPGDIGAEYVERESCYKISSPGGYANKAEAYKKQLWEWFVQVRRLPRLPSVGDDMALSPGSYISDDNF